MIDRSTLSALVRDILAEELDALRGSGAFADTAPKPQVRKEAVSIRNDAELMAFVQRILDVAKDGKSRQEIESGRWVFSLSGGGASKGASVDAVSSISAAPAQRAAQPANAGGETVSISSGLVSERQIDSLPGNTRVVRLSGRAVLTPLAHDRARQKGIVIERSKK